ncbi:hypothetical protein [Leptolyngbya sp. 7M]|uniref:hypothetical protein n=1 Tax=Leptolyngbya sp. 7M TaxID=2812896 RepID=UPI001B8B6A4B|nr:hypothetical protein [Leptolyngbya sp. 7M]QYO62349.1 hypothetical protein JVX88_19885 [Leptolyngbya sp. 7M]
MKRVFPRSFVVFGIVLFIVGSNFGQTSSVAGEWEGTYNTPGGARPLRFMLVVDGEKLTGTVKRPNGDVPLAGSIKGDKIDFSYTISYGGNDLTLFFTGKVEANKMSGTVLIGSTEDTWSAQRSASGS